MSARASSEAFSNDEAGFTVAELAVVMLLFAIVGVVVATSLISLTNATASAESRTNALAEARLAVETIGRDLRAADPLDPLPAVSDYATKVSFSVYCSTPSAATGCNSNRLRPVVYQVVNNELRRTVAGQTRVLLGPTGPTGLPRARQRGAVVNKSTEPVFTYFNQQGGELTLVGSPLTFRNCTKSVKIRIAVVSDIQRLDRDVDLSTEVNLRNYNQVTNCTSTP